MSEPMSCTIPPHSPVSSSFEPDPGESQCLPPEQGGSGSAPLQSIDPAKTPSVSSSDSSAATPRGDQEALECRGSDELVRRYDNHSGTVQQTASNPQGSDDVRIVDVVGFKSNGGIDVEVGGAALEAGSRTAGKLTVGRVVVVSSDGQSNLSLEGPHAAGSLGERNPDGSTGLHVGGSLNLAALEGTWGDDGNSLTFGLSAGFGFEVSGGVRDADSDGRDETCWRVGVGPFTLGQCAEADEVDTSGPATGASGSDGLDRNSGAGGRAGY